MSDIPENSVFVVGFPNTTTGDALQAFIASKIGGASKIADVTMCKGRARRTDDAGVAFAFVTLADAASSAAVINLDKIAFSGDTTLKIEARGGRAANTRANNSVFITGFAENTTAEQLKRLLTDACGKTIGDAEVDLRTGRAKKDAPEEDAKVYAFVFLPSAAAKEAVLKMNGQGALVVEERSARREKPVRAKKPVADRAAAPVSPSLQVFVTGFDKSTTAEQLKRLLAASDAEVDLRTGRAKKETPDEEGKVYAFVLLSSAAAKDAVLKKNGQGTLVVEERTAKPTRAKKQDDGAAPAASSRAARGRGRGRGPRKEKEQK